MALINRTLFTLLKRLRLAVDGAQGEIRTLTDDYTETVYDEQVLVIDPGGASRDWDLLPVEGNAGLLKRYKNAGSLGEIITFQDATPTTIDTLDADEWCDLYCDGSAWHLVAGSNATQNTSFDSIDVNDIDERDAGHGVVIDGAKILDGHILDSVGFYDAADPTKIVRLDAGGTTAERIITMADTDVDLADIATQGGQIAALGAENIDGHCQIAILTGATEDGTWTKAVAAGLETVTRTAAAAAENYWIPVVIPGRSAALKGIKPTGLRVNYSVNTADLDDVRFELWKVTQGADGAARTAAVIFGDADADYDADHDTAAKRGDDTAGPELHLAVVTDAAGAAYLDADETLLLRVIVDGDAGAAGVFVLTSAVLLFSETLVDLA